MQHANRDQRDPMPRWSASLAALALLSTPAWPSRRPTSGAWRAEAYGEPSETAPGSPAELSLSLVRPDAPDAAIRLDGGTPGGVAVLLLGPERGERPLGGATLLVGPGARYAIGRLDRLGAWEHPLEEVPPELSIDTFYARRRTGRRRSTGRRAWSSALGSGSSPRASPRAKARARSPGPSCPRSSSRSSPTSWRTASWRRR